MTQPSLPLADQWLHRAQPAKNAKAARPASPRRLRVVPKPDVPVERVEPGLGVPDLLLEVPNPDDWLNANQRPGTSKGSAKALEARRNRLSQAWIDAVGWAVKAAKPAPLECVRIVAWLDTPNVNRRHDPNNWAPTAKAAVDGLVKAGLLPDDDWKHVIGPDMRRGVLYPAPGRLVLGIYDLTRRENESDG